MAELAKAYVQIVPSAEGIQGSIASVMNGESESAGKSGGENFAKNFGDMAKKALVSLGIGKIITDAINNTADFEETMAKVSTLFTGTDEQWQSLQQTVLDLSSTYGLSSTTIAEAAYSAESASVSVENLGTMLEGSAKLATAGFTDIDTALSATAKTMNAYGDSAMSVDEIQKVLIQTQNLGITTVGELGASLANVTPTAAAAGVRFDQVGAALAQMTAQGVPTAQATTQLRAALTELSKSGTSADKAFRAAAKGTDYSRMSFQEAIASGANLADVFGLMQAYADKTGKSMVDLWGSVEAGNAAMMIASDVETFNSNLEAMSTEADVVGEAYEKMADTFNNSMSRLKESATNFMTTLFTGGDVSASFDAMLDSLGDVGSKLQTWLTNGLRGLGENLPGMMSSLLDFGESLLDSLAQVDWISLGTTIINGIIGALGTLGTRLIEIVSNAIQAVASGEIDFASIGTAIWNGITSIITTAGDWLSTLFNSAVTAVSGISFSEIGSKILAGVTAFIDGAGGFLKTLFETALGAVTGVDFSGIGSTILSGVTGMIDTAGDFLGNLFKSGKTSAEGVGYASLGTKIFEGVKSAILPDGSFLSNLFKKGKTESEGLSWSDVGDVIKAGVDLIVGGGEFLASAFSAGKELVEAMNWTAIGESISGAVTGIIDSGGAFLSDCFDAASTTIQAMDWTAIGQSISDGVTGIIDGSGEFLSSCFEAGKTLIESIQWQDIGQSISDGVTGLIDASGAFLSSCFEAGKSLIEGIQWTEVGQSISDGVTGIIDAAGTFLSSCFEAGKSLIEGITWSEIGTAIGNGVTGTIDAAGEFLAAPFRAAKTLIEGIPWGEVGSAISSGLGTVWQGITDFVGGTLSGAGSAMSGFGEYVGANFTAGANNISEWVSSLDSLEKRITTLKTDMTNLESTLKDNISQVEEAAKSVSKTIKDGLKSELSADTIKGIGKDTVMNLKTGLSDSGVNSLLTTAAKGLADAISGEIQNVDYAADGLDVITELTSGIAEAHMQPVDEVNSIVTDASDAISTYGWMTVGSDIIEDLTDGVNSVADTSFVQAMRDTVADFVGVVNEEDWFTLGLSIMQNMALGVDDGMELYDAFLNAETDAKGVFTDEDWKSIGADIVKGIASGISTTAGQLYQQMKTLARNALTAAKAELRIGSPSKLMRDEIGQWIPAGIAAGINESSGIVTDAMNDMLSDSAGTDISAQLSAQGQRLGQTIDSGAAPWSLADLRSGIVSAIREGMESANIPVFMDGQRVSEEVDRYLGGSLTARRFATT